MSWIVSYWMDLLELWKQVSAIVSLLHVSPVTEIKKQIKVFIYFIMLNISSNVPHVQNYYSMRRSSKKIEQWRPHRGGIWGRCPPPPRLMAPPPPPALWRPPPHPIHTHIVTRANACTRTPRQLIKHLCFV